jgi:hypothetical protein
MYSDIINGLGFSQRTLETMILVMFFVFILGTILMLYWKYIMFGALAFSCFFVLANHKSPEPVVEKKPEVVIDKKEEVINQVKPDEEVMSEPKDARNMFMEDCINLADYTRTQCENLWLDRVQEERAILENTKQRVKI